MQKKEVWLHTQVTRDVRDVSITRDVRGGGCEMYTPLPSTQLTFRNGSSKLDCTGLKINPFRNRWAYIAVFRLILKWKSHAIA